MFNVNFLSEVKELTIMFLDLTIVRTSDENELEEELRQYGKGKDMDGTARQFALGVILTSVGRLCHT